MFQLSGAENEPVQLRLELETDSGLSRIVPESFPNIYQEQVAAHVRSIKENSYTDGSDAIHNLELLFACFESADNGAGFIRI